LNDFEVEECEKLFRFTPTELHRICRALRLPENCTGINRVAFTGKKSEVHKLLAMQ